MDNTYYVSFDAHLRSGYKNDVGYGSLIKRNRSRFVSYNNDNSEDVNCVHFEMNDGIESLLSFFKELSRFIVRPMKVTLNGSSKKLMYKVKPSTDNDFLVFQEKTITYDSTNHEEVSRVFCDLVKEAIDLGVSKDDLYGIIDRSILLKVRNE